MRRCLRTQNECGTDTYRVGWRCPCLQCVAWRAEQRLANEAPAVTRRRWREAFEKWPPHPRPDPPPSEDMNLANRRAGYGTK